MKLPTYDRDAARALIKFLTGPAAIPVVKVQGMEPDQ